MLKQISIDDLQPGMFVSQVLEQTGNIKVRSGGLVKTARVIEQLRHKGIQRIEIDLTKSILAPANKKSSLPPVLPAAASEKDALASAAALFETAVAKQKELVDLLKNQSAQSLEVVDELASGIIDSVFHNQDAMACLTMIKNADEYMLEHSINCSVLMAIFANQLGYDRATTNVLCTGSLLMDIGMARVPAELRNRTTELSTNDWQIIRSHVEQGVEMVAPFKTLEEPVIMIISEHHERVDGSGYPAGLSGENITVFARMAAIIDTYDAMISERPHQQAVAPAVAFKRLVQDTGLDQDLVRQFVRCIGVHPVGSLVQLKSGRLAIVARTNDDDMLKPVVMSFYSVNSSNYSEIRRIDLAHADDEIVKSVRPDDFGLNLPKFFKDIFIHQMPD